MYIVVIMVTSYWC